MRAAAVPVAELQVDVEGLAVAGLGLGEPPLLLGDRAELMVDDALCLPVAGGLQQAELGLVVASWRRPGDAGTRRARRGRAEGEFYLLVARLAGCRVGGDGVIEELAAGVVLLGLVEVFIERRDERRLMGWPVLQPVGQGGGQVGVFGSGGGLPGEPLLRAFP